jgi:hypothetical protein
MAVMFVDYCVGGERYITYYFYLKKSYGAGVFHTRLTPIVVKLLKEFILV